MGLASLRGEPVLFSFEPPIAAQTVHLAGDFNGFTPDQDPMQEEGGVFRLRLDLAPGRYRYKFVVNQTVWLPDPAALESEEDGFGGVNSIRVVEARRRPSRLHDHRIDSTALLHDPKNPLYARRVNSGLELGLRVRAEDVEAVWVETQEGESFPLELVPLPHSFALARGRIPPTQGYRFRLQDGFQRDGWGRAGWANRPQEASFFPGSKVPSYRVPEWVSEAVFYQIFPDRFANFDPKNDPEPRQPWGSPPKIEGFQGGDLEGITAHLEGLSKFGITALYLNPIFAAGSNHRYDTHDYMRIDPGLGTLADFQGLRAQSRELGIRLVLDGVFNHSGDGHWAFRDLKEKGPRSKYRAWFRVKSFPIRMLDGGEPSYAAWWGFSHLPELNTDHPEVRAHLREVVQFWAQEGIDGWRLDVPNEVDHGFWKAFRGWVEAANPEAYLVGEIWQDGHPWMQGDEFHGVMNYRLRGLLLDFFVRRTRTGFETLQAIQALENSHPPQFYQAMLNLLGSHDTERLRTLAGGDTRVLQGAYSFLFTSQGAPCIYYGDEVGLTGGKDPGCRKAYPWASPPEFDLRPEISHLTQLRKRHPDLRRAPLEPLPAPADWMVFRRGSLRLALSRPSTEPSSAKDSPLPDWVPSDWPVGKLFFAPETSSGTSSAPSP